MHGPLALLLITLLVCVCGSTFHEGDDLFDDVQEEMGQARINLFSNEDIHSMTPEEVEDRFGDPWEKRRKGGRRNKMTAEDARERLVEFYTRYRLFDKLDNIPVILEKYHGRYDKMFSILYRKYVDTIAQVWDDLGEDGLASEDVMEQMRQERRELRPEL